MITEIEIENFKSLEKVRLKLGKLNLFVGTNASGKSNFLEALRVLQGIGYGFSIDEIFNGKPKSAISDVWEGIRGGSARAAFWGRTQSNSKAVSIRAAMELRPAEVRDLSYFIEMVPGEVYVSREELKLGSEPLFNAIAGALGLTFNVTNYYGTPDEVTTFGLDIARPALSQLQEVVSKAGRQDINAVRIALSNMQAVHPDSAILRTYSQATIARRMGESGENFAALVKAILENPKRRSAYISWLRELVPFEAEDVEILTGAVGEPLFALRREDLELPTPAPVLSDGTLRFAALTAAFFQPDMPDILTIEEIENGIHPSRLRLLVELLKSQSSEDGPQVFATTHSPVVLAWLEEEDYETTFFCKRDDETGASVIKPLSEIPYLLDLVKRRSLGELFMEGWMETVR